MPVRLHVHQSVKVGLTMAKFQNRQILANHLLRLNRSRSLVQTNLIAFVTLVALVVIGTISTTALIGLAGYTPPIG